MTDKLRVAPPRQIDEGLLLALSRDAGNLIHDYSLTSTTARSVYD
jgi:hypothetical protein